MTLLSASPIVYALSLVPALLWGVSSVLSKRGMAEGGSSLHASFVVVSVATVLYWTALLAVQGTDVFGHLPPRTVVIFLLAGVVGTAFGRLAVFAGVERVGASVNSAVISARPLFAAALAFGFLGESVTLSTALGVGVLVCGLMVLALVRGGDVEGWDPPELLFPLGAAFFFAVGNVLRRFGLSSADATVLEAVTINEMAAVLVLGGYVVARRETSLRQMPNRTTLYFVGSGVVTSVSILSLFAALSLPDGRVAIVDSLAATSPLFTVVFSSVFLRDLERVTHGVVAGAVLIVAGVVLITAGSAIFGA